MSEPIRHEDEPVGNETRAAAVSVEPAALRTYTPSLAVLQSSAGVYHWTPDGRRLYDFTSGVLVANLGHNPTRWMKRLADYMNWPAQGLHSVTTDFVKAVPLTSYNAVTPLDAAASRRLIALLRSRPGGSRMESVLWAASGSEAIQKALWASMARDKTRPMIVATRFGFHGKKGLANAVTGSESDAERDPRVRFISFPTAECRDVSLRDAPFDPEPYRDELLALRNQFGPQLGCLITEPYLGGGGSYHPPSAYLQLLQQFCRENDMVFILDEVQSNFGRTGKLFAFEAYGLEPDVIVLGKGLGNGVPVAAAVGRGEVFRSLGYGEGSDTWSANPLASAAVLATLDEFEGGAVLEVCRAVSDEIEAGLIRLKRYPFISHVRGERRGMVWGVETKEHGGLTAAEWANALVLSAYRGDGSTGIHLLGPLATKVIRIAPPLVISPTEAEEAVNLLDRAASRIAEQTPAVSHAG
ncbi:MAG TPA: aspartate aminotransferase family protein [Fimbriiglobus sp.]|jgi:4-aminobutyrate aminotransferase-like enzyme